MAESIRQFLLHADVKNSVELKLLHDNIDRKTWLVSGKLPWGVEFAVIKIVDELFVDEIKFYKENLLSTYRPELYFVDTDNRFVIMEYLHPCEIWDEESLKTALEFMAEIHAANWENENIPDWLPFLESISDKQINFFHSAIEKKLKCIVPYAKTLINGAEKVIAMFPETLKSPRTIIHGDFMYVNMGIGKYGLVLFDWSNVMFASPSYELCYTLEHFSEVFGDTMDTNDMIYYYLEQMEQRNIYLNAEQFKSEYILNYLHRCLFSYIPSYINKGNIEALNRKVPIVCEMIQKMKPGKGR